MAALTGARVTESKGDLKPREYKVAASALCYAGGIAMLASTGGVKPATAEASNKGCVGVFAETVDNSSGSLGDKVVKVLEGTFKFAGTTLSDADVGSLVYAEDDQTVDETQATNEPRAGILEKIDSTSIGWVRMSLEIARL